MSSDSLTAHAATLTERQFLHDVLAGLSRPSGEKQIPSRYLYDERGCALFDAICETPEYYPTRTELSIMRREASAMAKVCGTDCRLLELGCGSSIKTELLLAELDQPAVYVPVDFAEDYLTPTVQRLNQKFPELRIEPLCADFSRPFDVPADLPGKSTVVYFPGSTIGNFHQHQAADLLKRMRGLCGSTGGMLIGMDLKKDREQLEAAYNDAQGVTAAFTSNLLTRMQEELDAELDAAHFEHLARYNEERGRIEIYLHSLRDQSILVGEQRFALAEGELINTEYSYKYSLDDVHQLARAAGWGLTHAWLDERGRFGVFFLR